MIISHKLKFIAFGALLALIFMGGLVVSRCHSDDRDPLAMPDIPSNPEIARDAGRFVTLETDPPTRHSIDVMRKGVFQHIDRRYTYDIVPEELVGGFLYQGVHRFPKGATIFITVHRPVVAYFFFHETSDGGYGRLFEGEEGWVRCADAPPV